MRLQILRMRLVVHGRRRRQRSLGPCLLRQELGIWLVGLHLLLLRHSQLAVGFSRLNMLML